MLDAFYFMVILLPPLLRGVAHKGKRSSHLATTICLELGYCLLTTPKPQLPTAFPRLSLDTAEYPELSRSLKPAVTTHSATILRPPNEHHEYNHLARPLANRSCHGLSPPIKDVEGKTKHRNYAKW